MRPRAAIPPEPEPMPAASDSARSRHHVLLGGCLVAGPVRGHPDASGWVPPLLFAVTGLLFALCYRYVARGVWVQLAPLLYAGCWLVLWAAAYVDPGIVPRRWQLPPPEQQTAAQRELLTQAGPAGRKFCSTCRVFRPLDAHHCAVCDACVGGFDHHCRWLGTCIGERNHRAFVVFNIYATTMALLVAWQCWLQLRLGAGEKPLAVPTHAGWACYGPARRWFVHPSVPWFFATAFCIAIILLALSNCGCLSGEVRAIPQLPMTC